MRDAIILFVHLMVTLVRPGGLRSVVAESVLVKHQLLILILRGREWAFNTRTMKSTNPLEERYVRMLHTEMFDKISKERRTDRRASDLSWRTLAYGTCFGGNDGKVHQGNSDRAGSHGIFPEIRIQ
jgi:hypothetical protein